MWRFSKFCLELSVCLLCAGCGPNETDLTELNRSCIQVEEISGGSSGAENGSGETAVRITMPDYAALYRETAKAEDFQACLADVLQSGNYSTVQFTKTVPVTAKDGNRTVQSDEAVNSLLEQELFRAINALEEAP